MRSIKAIHNVMNSLCNFFLETRLDSFTKKRAKLFRFLFISTLLAFKHITIDRRNILNFYIPRKEDIFVVSHTISNFKLILFIYYSTLKSAFNLLIISFKEAGYTTRKTCNTAFCYLNSTLLPYPSILA